MLIKRRRVVPTVFGHVNGFYEGGSILVHLLLAFVIWPFTAHPFETEHRPWAGL